MDWLELLYKLIEVALIPIIGIVATYVVQYLQAKKVEANNKIESELLDKYVGMLFDTVSLCVTATSQTYVESLKSQGQFNEEAHKTAFQITYDAVMGILSAEAKNYLTAAMGDLNLFVTKLIESEVNRNK